MEQVNLQVHDFILHEVFKRGSDQVVVPPQYGAQTEVLDVDALDALRDRIVTAMTSSTRCVQWHHPNPISPVAMIEVEAQAAATTSIRFQRTLIAAALTSTSV